MKKSTVIRVNLKTWNRLLDLKIKERTSVKFETFDELINKLLDVYESDKR